jgi:hypothetical protein
MNFEAVGPERLVLVARDPWILPPPTLGERRHRGLARRRVAVRRRAR